MLRTGFASKLIGEQPSGRPAGIEYACAAVELIHTASLFHDDVIDGASLRRGKPSLWRSLTPNSAILLGDIVLCEALDLLACSETKDFIPQLLSKVREVCMAEIEQELILRGLKCDNTTCLRIARSKTGPLFAFNGLVCSGHDHDLAEALQEAGYRVGTAYQLADDLIDENGDAAVTGKTLGTDRLRSKFTIAHDKKDNGKRIAGHILQLCTSSLDLLNRWPDKKAGLRSFLDEILYPSIMSPVAGIIPERSVFDRKTETRAIPLEVS